MLDFGEIVIIGGVALVVLGPERLPQAARTMGSWIGRMQGYLTQVRTEFDREFHLADLRAIGEEARTGVRSVETAVRGAVTSFQSEAQSVRDQTMSALEGASWTGGPSAPATSFAKRYRPRPTIDDINQDIEQIKRQLAVPASGARARNRFAPRARINRARVRR